MKKFSKILVKFSIAVIFVSIFSLLMFDHSNRSIFGYKIVSVNNNDMQSEGIQDNDLVLLKEVNPSTLQIGDIITFRSLNSHNYFDIITHKITKRTIDVDEYPGFVTSSTNNQEDERLVKYEYIFGKHVCTIKGGGVFYKFLKSSLGYICCIFLPFLILIITFISFRIEKMPKKEKISVRKTKKRMARVKVNNTKNEKLNIKSRKLIQK